MENQTTIVPPASAPVTLYAGFWKRLGAALIDAIILVVGAIIIGMVAGIVTGGSLFAASLLSMLGMVAYHIYMNGTFGATVGKMALGIKIVQLDGRAIDYSIAALRYSPFIAFGVISLVFGASQSAAPALDAGTVLNLLYCLAAIVVLIINPMKRTIHDFLAKTVVINKGAALPATA